MKVYRNYTAKKFKLSKRIIFFVCCALVIFLFAVLLGNYLKKRLDNTDINREPIETSDIESENNNNSTSIENGNASHGNIPDGVRAGYLDLYGVVDTADLTARIDDLKALGFNAVSFAAVKEERLTYASKAMEEYSRLPASSDIISLETLSEALSIAHGKGLRTSAIYKKGEMQSLDILAIGELDALGFDEIIICGMEDILGENGGEITPSIIYLREIRSAIKNAALSISLSTEAYRHQRNSYQIEKLFTYAEFLSVDLSGVAPDAASDFALQLSGSFQVYSLRPIVLGENDLSGALSSAEITSIQYISGLPKPENSETTEAE